ncbi:hypothetical protein NTHI1209_02124 [Haemophilus influenzae]|uniref:Uncharacterized protein n=1 Tax=Haemophilus influenzae TaxID=727 RepID=A0A158T025_HAEIF|nr:hypothetical protein NTHI1209_02124 [Haemophilus influenzae]
MGLVSFKPNGLLPNSIMYSLTVIKISLLGWFCFFHFILFVIH